MILNFPYKECCGLLNLGDISSRSSPDFQALLCCHIGHVQIRGLDQEYSTLWAAVQRLVRDPRMSICQSLPMTRPHELQLISRKEGVGDKFLMITGSPAPLSSNSKTLALPNPQHGNELLTVHDATTSILAQGIQPQRGEEKPMELGKYTVILQGLSDMRGIPLSYDDRGPSESGFIFVASYGGLQGRGEAGNKKEAKHKASKALFEILSHENEA
jgi:hypothetical protein